MHEIRNDATVSNILDRLGIIELLNGEGVTEVMINRPFECFVEGAQGVTRIENPNLSLIALEQMANTLAIYNQKHISRENPIHSVTLPDGERGQMIIPPACEAQTAVFAFRKPSKSRFDLSAYSTSGRLAHFADTAVDGRHFRDVSETPDNGVVLKDWQKQMLDFKADRNMERFFQTAVQHKLNICMVGGTGSGKTTFTKAIADLIPEDTRIITIEDTHELDLPKHPNHVHLFYKEHITAKQIIAACMRLKPDRIFLTELRGDEAWDYLAALNTGHPGGLTSVHANDALSAFYRIAQLAKESATGRTMDYDFILDTVRSTVDIVCFFEKTRLTQLYFDPVAKLKALQNKSGRH